MTFRDWTPMQGAPIFTSMREVAVNQTTFIHFSSMKFYDSIILRNSFRCPLFRSRTQNEMDTRTTAAGDVGGSDKKLVSSGKQLSPEGIPISRHSNLHGFTFFGNERLSALWGTARAERLIRWANFSKMKRVRRSGKRNWHRRHLLKKSINSCIRGLFFFFFSSMLNINS